MMHDGYFVGRKELTAWIQSSFNPAFQKVEDLANGVVYCQIINSVYPGALPMAKVKMGARTEVDCLHNFKLLQTAFNKKKVDRYIDLFDLASLRVRTLGGASKGGKGGKGGEKGGGCCGVNIVIQRRKLPKFSVFRIPYTIHTP